MQVLNDKNNQHHQRNDDDNDDDDDKSNEVQHEEKLPGLEPFHNMAHYVNCTLFKSGGGESPQNFHIALFIYGAPLEKITKIDKLYTPAIAGSIGWPSFGSNDSWYPYEFSEIIKTFNGDSSNNNNLAMCSANYPDLHNYRIYQTMVLRIIFLLRMIKSMNAIQTAASDSKPETIERSKMARRNELLLYKWFDAHILMAINIQEIGYPPPDDSEEMAVILERYSPNVDTMLTEHELPDLSREIQRFSPFAPQSLQRKEDPILTMLHKCLPTRCEKREAAIKAADIAAWNSSVFGFVKLTMAAMYLAIYPNSKYHGGWRLRYAVYRLFFFTMDERLKHLCIAPMRPDGSLAPRGGTAQHMAEEYDLNEIYDSMNLDGVQKDANGSTTSKKAKRAQEKAKKIATTISFRHYPKMVAEMYISEQTNEEKRRRGRKNAAAATAITTADQSNTQPAPQAAALQENSIPQISKDDSELGGVEAIAKEIVPPQATRGRRRSSSAPPTTKVRKSVPKLRDKAMRPIVGTKAKPNLIRQGLYVQAQHEYDTNREFADGLYVSNAIARLTVERNRGSLYYTQRRDAYTAAAGENALDSFPPPDIRDEVKYKDTAKRVLPEDRWLPDEEELQRDCIIYHCLSIVICRKKEGAKTPDKEFYYQDAYNLALRLYLIHALELWNEPVLRSLYARTDWAQWQVGVSIVADTFRRNLDTLYLKPCKLGAFLTTYSVHKGMNIVDSDSSRASLMSNLFTIEKKPYLETVLRLMTQKMNNNGFADAPVDHVLTQETPVLIQHLLEYYQYPKQQPPIEFDKVRRNAPAAAATSTSTTNTQSTGFQQLHERVLPAQLSFLIEPTIRMPEVNATREEINRDFVSLARFPLKLFHASDEAIKEFVQYRHMYHMSPSDPIVSEYVEWLAQHSVYQFNLMYTFLRCVAVYMSIYTVPLPTHIVQHQLRSIRQQHFIPPNEPVPRWSLRVLVCRGCQHCAAVMPSAKKPQRYTDVGYGNDHVRFCTSTETTNDELVFEAVKRRGFKPMELCDMLPAKSMTQVNQHRARTHAHVYDKYCRESQEVPAEVLENPEKFGFLPARPKPADIDQRASTIFANMFSSENIAKFSEPTNILTEIRPQYTQPLPPMQLVASGQGKLGEMDFDARLMQEVNRRMAFYSIQEKPESFLLWGHALENRDRSFGLVRVTCATPANKSEGKKAKQLDQSRRTLEGSSKSKDTQDRGVVTYVAKRRRDAQSSARVAECSRRQMQEVSLLGRALYIQTIFAVSRSQQSQQENDFLFACCDCTGKTKASEAEPIGDRLVCKPCFTLSCMRSGIVAKRTVRGESTKSISTARIEALSNETNQLMRSAYNQKLLSPSYTSLHSDVIPIGTCCAMDRCRHAKTEERDMIGLLVISDIDVGSETFKYIYFCLEHGQRFSVLFKSPFVMPLSSIKVFMLQGIRKFDIGLTSGNFLDQYLRHAAQSAHIGATAERREKALKQYKRQTSLKQKRKEKELAEAARMASEGEVALSMAQPLKRKRAEKKKTAEDEDDQDDDGADQQIARFQSRFSTSNDDDIDDAVDDEVRVRTKKQSNKKNQLDDE